MLYIPINAALYWLQGMLPLKIIAEPGRPYLERAYLFSALGHRFYLHRFVDSDPDRGLHDHPWPWAFSIILLGRYLEFTRSGSRVVRWFSFLLGDNFHRVVMLDSRPVWTLFVIRARNAKPWGFWRVEDDGTSTWVPWNFPEDGESTSGEWWLQVPRGRFEPMRQPVEGITT